MKSFNQVSVAIGVTHLISIGRPGGTRTPNIRFWRPALYQFELLAYVNTLRNTTDLLCFTYALCEFCMYLQNFLNSSRSVVFFLFLVVE